MAGTLVSGPGYGMKWGGQGVALPAGGAWTREGGDGKELTKDSLRERRCVEQRL